MGAWGQGPFDNDSALDFLGNLADKVAVLDEDGDVVAGSVDYETVKQEFQAVLADIGSSNWFRHEATYAAAGVVAAALHPELAGANTGTRLSERFTGGNVSNIGLSGHCGYAALLDRDTALTLKEQAKNGIELLKADESWLECWIDEGIVDTLNDLAAVIDN